MKSKIKTPLTIKSNNKKFLKTREFPQKGKYYPNSLRYIEVKWTELWEKEGEEVEVNFSRMYTDRYTRYEGWNVASSFAFNLLSGFVSSVNKRKNWKMTKDNPCTCCMSFSKVKSVEVNVNFDLDLLED